MISPTEQIRIEAQNFFLGKEEAVAGVGLVEDGVLKVAFLLTHESPEARASIRLWAAAHDVPAWIAVTGVSQAAGIP